ncbi:MAG TPA: DUF4386 domain-containing protein [Chthoniobacterales bacterium]|nr:DUF4386 domain-containing protein [Chthoniobacterales bacterium]
MSTDVLIDKLERPETRPAAITPTQHRVAKVVGFLYLIQMAFAIFGESFVRNRLIVPSDAVQTAANLVASERLFRLSLAGDLMIYASVIVLFWGIYIILKPVNKDVALLGAFFRLVEQAVLAVTTFAGFIALRLLSGPEYLRVVDTAQLQAFARAFISMYGIGLSIGFVFLGLGSAVFSYVWLKSRYIPRALALLGIFGSLLLAVMTLVTMVFPRVYEVLGMSYMMPMGLYEVGLGFWLLIKGIKAPTPQQN